MKFDLKILNSRQDFALVTLDALNSDDATTQARKMGHVVLSVKRSAVQNQSRLLSRTAFPLVLFSQELLSLLDAGLSLLEAIETMREKEHRPAAKGVLDQIRQSLHEGLPFSQALRKTTDTFPALYIALIRSAEQTGDLVEALSRYVDYQSQVDLVRKKIINSSIYPALLMIVGGLVILFLMLYVVPKFSAIYEANTDQLPILSQWLLAWGRILHSHAAATLTSMVVFLLVFIFSISRPRFLRKVLELLSSIPAIGERLRIYQLARVYRTLGMLLRGGIPAVTALDMVQGLLQVQHHQNLQRALSEIKEGISISVAMENHGLTTAVATRMLRVGERSGKMGEMMERIGHFYDDEIARWIDRFTRLFEPVLMTVIGIFVGLIVILMYLPIFELAGSIQ